MDIAKAREQLEGLLATTGPAGLVFEPRPGTQPLAALNRRMDEALEALGASEGQADLLRALLLLWHDHMEPAHALAQEIENRDGSYVHAILHRREPDYSNAKYWFRRVGQHPCFAELAARAEELLRHADEPALLGQLSPAGRWDSFAFVDACEVAQGSAAVGRAGVLREIQRAEFEVLLRCLLEAASARK